MTRGGPIIAETDGPGGGGEEPLILGDHLFRDRVLYP